MATSIEGALIVVMSQNGEGTIVDQTPNLLENKLIGQNGFDVADNHLYVPSPCPRKGIYRIENLMVWGGGWQTSGDERSWEPHELSGTWKLLTTWDVAINEILTTFEVRT